MGYLRAIFTKRLWTNMIIAIAVFSLVLWAIWSWMGSYTRHGEKVLVPDLQGYTLGEAEDVLGDRSLKAVVIDSVFTDKVARGTVFAQTPEEGQEVKPERKIYITLNATQRKLLKMPDLMNQSKRQAIRMLELVGLEVGEVSESRDDCNGCVVGQKYEGKSISAGTMIREGEKIDLVLGDGSGNAAPTDDGTSGSESSSDDSIEAEVSNNRKADVLADRNKE